MKKRIKEINFGQFYKDDPSKSNLIALRQIYEEYRNMQYLLITQYDKVLEDPRFDELYLDMSTVSKYRQYIDDDINGEKGFDNTTAIIKSLKQLERQYDEAVKNIQLDQ